MDCTLRPNIKSATPKVGVIADVENHRCVYAAVASDSENENVKVRGVFDSIQACIDKCFRNYFTKYKINFNIANIFNESETDIEEKMKQKIKGCSGDLYQFPHKTATPPLNPVMSYYHDKSTDKCLPFESWPGDFDPEKNNFASLELCESYCGASKYFVYN